MIRKCLADLGIDVSSEEEDSSSDKIYAKAMLEEAGSYNLDAQFAVVKKIYFARILEQHPDKGGDAAAFRDTRLAFEILRDMKSNGTLKTFLVGPGDGNDENMDADMADFEKYKDMYQDGATPSYEYYEAAAEVKEPGYKVELAKSGRSQCEGCKKGAKGSFRGKSHTAKPKANKAKKGKKTAKKTEPAAAAEPEPEPVAAPSANVEPEPVAAPSANVKTDPEPETDEEAVASTAMTVKSEIAAPEGVRRNPRRSTRAIVVAAKAKSSPHKKAAKAKPTKAKKAKKTEAAAAKIPPKSTEIVPAAVAA
ncbi:MAG: hypothetical protein SGILL_010040, partial [Bacillariaceae sp.]